MKRIALLGECMIELNGAPFGAMEQTYGGDSLNTAVYLARCAGQSINIDYISALGTDAISDGMLSRWQQEGVGTHYVLRDAQRQPGLYLIQLDDQGERTFLYWRNQSAARYMLQHPKFDKVSTHLKQVDWVYLSGISIAILPQEDRQQLIDLLAELTQSGVKVAFDSNYRPALWESVEQAQRCYQQIFSFTDLALVTNDDEEALWGDSCEEATLARLQQAGVRKAVVKMGAKGNFYQDFSTDDRMFIATNPVQTVIDTTSAGDSFNAGFLAGVLTEKDPIECSQQGHRLAGTVIQHKGAIIPHVATQDIDFNQAQ
ncbi:sugar kinase [Photobacterium sanctipauli]|uniref:2-dehydro-3-deoxygluconokinase n=1 Tax=Photobacterium sanctipauli TaxID=1342794 RepID=A0A2T3P0N6_9GAMM|nr:sugar kinase [Photobacterium sanctipauli]PSW22039.1 sugar kinase [Photobacterium sanctipauli]